MTARDVSKRDRGPGERVPARLLGGDVARPLAWLAAVTALAAALRLRGLASDLWLDEIATVFDVRAHSTLEIVSRFESANHHLLNSLAIAASTALLGDAEWAVRLSAALLGIAGVPAIYWLARSALGSREALLVALVTATSYHHVDFSQNARGYAGYLLGGTLATAILLRWLDDGGGRAAAGYVGAMLLALVSLPLAFFLLAGHAVGVAVAAPRPSRRRAAGALATIAAAGVAGLLLYAPAWGRAVAYATSTYRSPGFGAPLWSRDHLEAWLAGLTLGRSVPLAAVVAGAVLVAAAWLVYGRRQPRPARLLVAPLAMQALFATASGLHAQPRFFLWALVVAHFHLVAIGALVDERLDAARRRGRAAIALTLAAILPSVALLVAAEEVPKQPSRRRLEALVADLAPDGVVVAVGLAKWGARYYGPRVGLEEGRDLFVVETPGELAAVEARFGVARLHLVTTLERTLASEAPALAAAIERDYPVERSFAARIGDAQIRLRRHRSLLSSSAAAESPTPPSAALPAAR